MSEALHITRYSCHTCKQVYDDRASADLCESRPIIEDRGVKVGDLVLITGGDGAGKKARVETVYIVDKDWGHYAWERYWHTVALTAKVEDSWGHRMLVFDQYKTIDQAPPSSGDPEE
jgi:hypothetical protein